MGDYYAAQSTEKRLTKFRTREKQPWDAAQIAGIIAILKRHLGGTARAQQMGDPRRRLRFEQLELRTMLTVQVLGSPPWIEQGPGPEINGGSTLPAGQNNQVAGAIQCIAVDPNNPKHIIVGAANGGVWETKNADPSNPTSVVWNPISDHIGSMSIGAVAFDPRDATGNTFYAAIGNYSEFFTGGPALGLYKTTNDGATWNLLGFNSSGVNILAGNRLRSVVVIGSTVLVGAVNNNGLSVYKGGGGLFISTDSGATFSPLSGLAGAGNLPAGAVTSVIDDPTTAQTVYAGVVGQGVFKSTSGGAPGSWSAVNTNLSAIGADNTDIELDAQSIGGATTVFVGISSDGSITNATNASPIVITSANHGLVTGDQVLMQNVGGNTNANTGAFFVSITQVNGNQFSLNGKSGNAAYTANTGTFESFAVFTSTNAGGTWTRLANFGASQAFYAGGASFFAQKFCIEADPTNAGVVYIDGSFNDGAVRIYRYNPAGAGSWVPIDLSGTKNGTDPHADSRDMEFIGNNTLLESDDGGIVLMNNPTNAANNDWNSFNGTQTGSPTGSLKTNEFISVSYDQKNNVIFGGLQDNGSPEQTGGTTWTQALGGDGQYSAVDATSTDAGANVFHYSLSDNYSGFVRLTYNSSNVLLSTANVGLRSSFGAANLSGLNAPDLAGVCRVHS